MNTLALSVGFLLTASFCLSAVVALTSWNDLRVTYVPGDPATGFTQLPRTVKKATDEGWTVPPEEQANYFYKILCPSRDPSVCVLYDKKGDVNGIQIGLQVKDLSKTSYPAEKHPTFHRRSRFGYDMYIVTIYTVKPGSRLQSVGYGGYGGYSGYGTGYGHHQTGHLISGGKLETGNGVWIDRGPGGIRNFEVPRTESEIAYTKFIKQGCVPRMGTHYHYNISTTMSCDDYEPVVGLFDRDELIGVAVQTLGQASVIRKKWIEEYEGDGGDIKEITPEAPQCRVDGAAEYGFISIHIYFVSEPWNIKC